MIHGLSLDIVTARWVLGFTGGSEYAMRYVDGLHMGKQIEQAPDVTIDQAASR